MNYKLESYETICYFQETRFNQIQLINCLVFQVVFEAPDDKDKWFYILVIHQNRFVF